jgi:hypothetical protein
MFSTPSPIKALCAGGEAVIEINAVGGTRPYTYYVIPETEWLAGDQMKNMLTQNNFSRLYRYTYTSNVITVFSGTVDSPKYYWVAVQDAVESGTISGTNLLAWWKRVQVTSNSPFVITPGAAMDLMTTCPSGADGRIAFTISGATPFKNGYKIHKDGLFIRLSTNYDSGVGLAAGKYEFQVFDSLNCSKTIVYEVKEPKQLVFDIGHEDSGCDGATSNELWILSYDPSTGSGSNTTWRWRYTTDPSWSSGSSWYSLSTKATGLAAGVYYVELKDGNGCTKVWSNAAGNQAISIGQAHFKPVWKGTGFHVMNIYVVTAIRAGAAVPQCDEIAVYDEKYCVGTVKLSRTIDLRNASTHALIKASQKEFGERNGFTSLNPITFKYWDRNKQKEVVVRDVTFVSSPTWRPVHDVPFTPDGTAYVMLDWSNAAPVAHAGPDQTVNKGTLVTLDGSASSDRDDDPLTYFWTAPAGITLSSDMASKPTFTAPEVGVDTSYKFFLLVNDGTVMSANPDTVMVTVRNSTSSFTPPVREMEVKIHPNPTTGMFHISDENQSLQGCMVQVFNLYGQVILNRLIDSHACEINLSGQGNGLYIVKITGKSGTATRKILLDESRSTY